MSQRILGLDPGTNSLGWAVVEKNEDNTYTLIKKGVLRFDAGADDKGETLAAARRTARGIRRRFLRRRLRKIELLKLLVEYGWCPSIPEQALKDWRFQKKYPMIQEFLDWQKTDEHGNINPYYFRYRCLTEKLDLENSEEDRYVLGRALYHLVQRRGFKSNRKVDGTGEDSEFDNTKSKAKKDELDKVKTGIDKLDKQITEADCTYLGEYLYLLYAQALQPNTVKLRSRYTSRKMYEEEFYAICRMQGIDEENVNLLYNAIFFQRKLKSQKYTMGKCTFEKGCTRCIVSHPDYEEFRMWCFINNIKVKKRGYDFDFRPLNQMEREFAADIIMHHKSEFKFKIIAEKIAGKKNFCSVKDDESDKGPKTYIFNYDMNTDVPACPFIYEMMNLTGTEKWRVALAKIYTQSIVNGRTKSLQQVVNDVWHVLYDFEDDECLYKFGKEKLQLTDDKAKKFSKLSFRNDTASLSLRAVRNILPFLRKGLIYSHAVFMAKVPHLVKDAYTPEFEERLINDIVYDSKIGDKTIQSIVIESVMSVRPDLNESYIKEKLYHPSFVDVYKKETFSTNEIPQLGSPETKSFRNPTAMKALHQIRYVVNELLRQGIIDQTAQVNIEYPRALNNPAQQAGLELFQQWMKSRRDEAKNKICEFKGEDYIPTDDEILKVQLWLEQGEMDIYDAGVAKEPVTIEQVLGCEFDIDHIVPRSMRGDDGIINKVLTSSYNNRQVKKAQLPCQLPDYQYIRKNMAYERYYEPYKKLDTAIKKSKPQDFNGKRKKYANMLMRDYYKGKWERFTSTREPQGFSLWQGPGNATITRYLGMYLQSVFYNPLYPEKKQVWMVKNPITAYLRKMWGLQADEESKDRSNHCHHCIDAIVVACAGHHEMNLIAEKLKSEDTGFTYHFPMPWNTFLQDMKALPDNTVVYYRTKDKFGVYTKQRLKDLEKKKQGVISVGTRLYNTGDGIRDSLYKDTFYGCIRMNGEEVIVKRVPVETFKDKNKNNIENIVDKKVRDIVRQWVDEDGKDLPYQNSEKGIQIKTVHIKVNEIPSEVKGHRDVSVKNYKRAFLSKSDGNYRFAIYGDKNNKGFLILPNIEAAKIVKKSNNYADKDFLLPLTNEDGLPIIAELHKDQHIIFHDGDRQDVWNWTQEELVSRLWYITEFNKRGYIGVKFHQCGMPVSDIKKKGQCNSFDCLYKKEWIKMASSNYYNALFEDIDFTISPLGEIKLKI